MKTTLATFAAALCLLSAPLARAAEPRDVAIAVFPGPYAELVRRGIKPGLEARGYRVTVRETVDPVGLYADLVEGRIQANLAHDARYLRQFAFGLITVSRGVARTPGHGWARPDWMR